MKTKTALIKGITAYLAEFLLSKGYVALGVKRRPSLFNTPRIEPVCQDPHYADGSLVLLTAT
jgi:GDPmannose 4,6-dehydratase